MNNSFEHAKANANPDCQKCKGTGQYQYSSRGTPHFTICDWCCKHDQGFWQLKEHYDEHNNMWCCRGGCGLVKETPESPDTECPQCQTQYYGATQECDWCPGIQTKVRNRSL